MKWRGLAGLAAAVLAAGAAWWRKHPSACPYGQRFWVGAPHPFITRERLREALAPRPGETVLVVGPGTGYYALPVARWLAPAGELHVFDLQQPMLDHTMRRAAEQDLRNIVPRQGDARQLPYRRPAQLVQADPPVRRGSLPRARQFARAAVASAGRSKPGAGKASPRLSASSTLASVALVVRL